MASFEVVGTLKEKYDTQQVTQTFQKREFVITTDTGTQYPQFINMQLSQDKCSLLDPFNVGDEMKVSFNLRGREWHNPTKNITQYFNSLDAWRIEKASSTVPQTAPQSQATPAQTIDVMPNTEIVDDLPF